VRSGAKINCEALTKYGSVPRLKSPYVLSVLGVSVVVCLAEDFTTGGTEDTEKNENRRPKKCGFLASLATGMLPSPITRISKRIISRQLDDCSYWLAEHANE